MQRDMSVTLVNGSIRFAAWQLSGRYSTSGQWSRCMSKQPTTYRHRSNPVRSSQATASRTCASWPRTGDRYQTVRRAMQELRERGLVASRVGKGTFVKEHK